jgi:Zn-dependent M28 family amino/carboxypeptidase
MPRRIPLLLILSASVFGQTALPILPDVQTAMTELRKERFRAHMAFLADDLLEGRGTGTRGHELAARYTAAQFEALGLLPAGSAGTYYQRVPLLEMSVDAKKSEVFVIRDGTESRLEWGRDFIMLGNPANADSSVEAPVTFVGYGVSQPSRGYDDYVGADVKGKIVAFLDGAPGSLQTELRAHVGANQEKLRVARDHGAIGAIGLRLPESDNLLPWERSVIGATFPTMRWIGPDGHTSDTYPEIRSRAILSLGASEKLFEHAAKSWAEVLRDAHAAKPQSFLMPFRARLHEVSQFSKITSPNVIACLPGSDPKLKQEYVILSAHLDHLGIGPAIHGDTIYNGAVDDASGVAALLNIADAFVALPRAPARSILFLATTGEEKLGVGADYFVHFPTVPFQSIVTDINMDWASVLYTFDEVVAMGAADSTLDQVVNSDVSRLGLRVIPDPAPEELSFIHGDQYSFVKRGVPSLLMAEGLKARDPKVDAIKLQDQYGTHYHAPSDDMNQPLDFDAAVEFMQINFLVGYDVAQQPERPRWKPGDFFGETFSNK